MTIYIYQFNNAKGGMGFYAFNKKQKLGSYLTGMLLYADTKNALLDLIKERCDRVKSIIFVHWSIGSEYKERIL